MKADDPPGVGIGRCAKIGQGDVGGRHWHKARKVLVIRGRLGKNCWADSVDPHASRQFSGRGLDESLDKSVDARANRHRADYFLREDTRDEGERAAIGNKLSPNADEVDLSHSLRRERFGPLLIRGREQRGIGNLSGGTGYRVNRPYLGEECTQAADVSQVSLDVAR